MKAKIYSHEFLIGTTELTVGDESMGCVFGTFEPTELYFERVQKEVWGFWKTNKPNYERWHSLRFNAQLENGVFLFPQGDYTFDDIEDLTNEPIRIDIAGIDYQVLEDNFLNKFKKPFVVNPWSEIVITQKLAFENELMKELGNSKKSFLNIFRKSYEKKILFHLEFSAFCQDQRNDDVLFEINVSQREDKFVIVHLTWIGKKEKKGYPRMTYFKDYNEFVTLKMNPDKLEWES